MQHIRVLLVDDHPLVRAGFHRLLQSNDNIDVIGEASNSQEAYTLYREHEPDLVVMDLNMPIDTEGQDSLVSASGGLEAIRRIISHDPKAKILVLTVMESDPFPSHVLSAGAKGYLTKRCAPAELMEAVLAVSRGELYVAKEVQAQVEGALDDVPSAISKLTKRELQIFTLLAEGRSVSKIAEEIYLSPKTVHAHRTNIFRKLDVTSNSDVVHIAIRLGIVQA